MSSDLNQNANWHLDKKVPISIIFVIIFQCIAGLWVIADIHKDVELLKENRYEQRERDSRQDKANEEVVRLLRGDIKEVSGKLDRLIEKNARP